MGSAPKVPNIPSIPAVVGSNSAYGDTQQGQNVGSQDVSNYNITDPTSNQQFYQSGTDPATGMPIYSISRTYSPQQQQILEGQQGGQIGSGQAASSLGSMMQSLYGTPANLATGANSLASQMEDPVISNLEKTTLQFQQPQLDAQLKAQGLTENDAAYKQAMNQLTNQQISTFGQVASQFQPQAFTEAVTQNQLPLQNMGTLLGQANPAALTNSAGMGAQAQPANVVATDAATNQANMAAYQAQMAQYQNMISGVFGGAAGLLKLPTAGGSSVGGNMISAIPGLFGGG
jgi:hypothetical protein